MKTAEINKFRKTYTPYTKPCVYDGLKLAVLYDEKEWAKNFGARWDAKGHCWWLPYDILVTHPSGDEDVVYGELNKRKMIVGTYGEIKKSIAKESMIDATSRGEGATDVYHLRNVNNNKSVTIQHWSQIDVVRVEDHAPNGDDIRIYSPEEGRTKWDELIKEGYNRVNAEINA
tara:strand:+ start:390 stop:908 length:519 start_codon:yes stop_codon:yes gene_type:complete